MATIKAAIAPLNLGNDWPDQAQNLRDTLASYTLDNAWAEFAEKRRGRLKIGMDADIAVLSHDLAQRPAEAFIDVNAIVAVMGGQITFRREQ
jgi:predicted amidohydrolase YtcJ